MSTHVLFYRKGSQYILTCVQRTVITSVSSLLINASPCCSVILLRDYNYVDNEDVHYAAAAVAAAADDDDGDDNNSSCG